MPPSPALRFSPGRELKAADNHKRGRSLEGGILFKERDDDLALFNEMQSREKEDFLLQSTDDFEDSFSTKLRYFSDLKLGISAPGRGESSELMNAEGDKNDYEWLLTPPDTPLFPSLDDEPLPPNVPSRGRPRSQPISISRSSTMEKSYRSSRGSASPNRSSPSPRSGSNTIQSRGRPSSARNSSPTPSQRPATPSRRPSTPPPNKASPPAPRSSTPTPRRASTGSVTRGVSPIRNTAMGNSVSPKVRAWQSNIPGFSSEAPPNLRTSLGDRPVSYVRGSSPASRNGRDSSSRVGRQSMSPTPSRSVSSSHSQERDRISSYSKGSVASSGDDDVESLQSLHVGSLDRLASRRVGGILSSKVSAALPKKPARTFSPSSAPKRSFDSAIRQKDHWKSPPNMFRPLLSSVPSTTFYTGKGSTALCSLVSRTSSVTTSSNASSDHGVGAAHDTERSYHHHDDVVVESRKELYPTVQEDIFAFDRADDLNKDVGHDIQDGVPRSQLHDLDRDFTIRSEHGDFEEFSRQDVDMEVGSPLDTSRARGDFSEVDSLNSLVYLKICSRCGCKYNDVEALEADINLCLDCSKQDTVITAENPLVLSTSKGEEGNQQMDESELDTGVMELHSLTDNVSFVGDTVLHEVLGKQVDNSSHEQSLMDPQVEGFVAMLAEEGDKHKMASKRVTKEPTLGRSFSDIVTGSQQLSNCNALHTLKVDLVEGAGISVVLKKSSSSKGPVFQGRSFTASTLSYDDVSFTRDSANSLRSSFGHASTSGSSSLDLSSSARQMETTQVQRQLSGKKYDLESTRPQSSGSSFSGSLNNVPHRASFPLTSTLEDSVSGSQNNEVEITNTSSTNNGQPVSEEYLCERTDSSRTMDASTLQLEEHSELSPASKSVPLHENDEGYQDHAKNLSDTDALSPLESSVEAENSITNTSVDHNHTPEVPSHSRLASISEIESEDHLQSPPSSVRNDLSANLRGMSEEFEDPSLSVPSDKDATASVLRTSTSDHERRFLDESTVMVECHGGNKMGRSLTLEEATDTILFCSSIVHDLAYKAATIAIEKELSVPLNDSRPTVTILGKSIPDRKDTRGGVRARRSLKPSKVKQQQQQKQEEASVKSPSSAKVVENDENADDSMVRNVGLPNKMDSSKPPKLESKCNCTIM
ncbi:unnamed protein product [Linum trigynum]|uniref:Uncharacterized protein n=2 Tax=Linum trigynum TaxID=586398 RepID=A0AAV2CWC1_9ROSI